MSKKVYPFLKKYIKNLERKEKELKADLSVLYLAHEADITAAVHAAYLAQGNGPAGRAEIERLKQKITALRKDAPTDDAGEVKNTMLFPLSVLRFDKLNRLDVVKADIAVSEWSLAIQVAERINKHLKAYAEELFYALEDYLDLRNAMMSSAVLSAIVYDADYPVWTTLRNNHIRLTGTTFQRIQQAIARGEDAEEAAAEVTAYNARQAKHNGDSVMYYEGTRTTIETVRAVMQGADVRYYSVYVPDGQACETCRDISAHQMSDPVPMADMMPGVNAPPFHPYCRCGIEVVG